MQGEESISILIHVDTVTFFHHKHFDIYLGKTAGKNCTVKICTCSCSGDPTGSFRQCCM